MFGPSIDLPLVRRFRRLTKHVPVLALTFLVCAGAPNAAADDDTVPVPRLALSGDPEASAALHGTRPDGVKTLAPLPATDPGLRDGEPIYFDVEPTTIPLKTSRSIRLQNLIILGDHPQIDLALRFGGRYRRFERLERRMMEGAVVSIFDATFPPEDLYAHGPPPVRFDHTDRAVLDTTGFLRLRPATIPKTPVVRISDRVQYSSHVVNIVADYDGLSVFELPGRQIAQEFYRHFTDTYEELAFVPERIYWSPCCGARQERVYQDVEGIGMDLMDDRAIYSGSEVLRGWIFYIRGDLQSNYLSVHETGHNWGWFISLFDAAGINVQGPTECAGLEFDGTSVHAPLMGDQHIFLSHCVYSPLYLDRYDGGLRVARTQPPLTFHPLTLYAMGLLQAQDVPPMYVSASQGALPSLTPGTRIEGELTEVTVGDVVRAYGSRTGPAVPPVWRRAVIVVSPQRLLAEEDLRWFNFWAKRISDPDVTGIESLAGVPSLEIATGNRLDVQTEIRPRAQPPIPGDFAVTYPKLGKRDVRGLKLRRELPSHFEAGRTYRIKGKVRLAGDYETVDIAIGAQVFSARIGAKRKFSLRIKLAEADRGRHWLMIGLDDFDRTLGRIAPVHVD